MESLAVDIESRVSGLWNKVGPEECFIAQYNDISNYMILVNQKRVLFCLTFSGDYYQFMFNERGKKWSFLLPSILGFVDLLQRIHKFVCMCKSA